LAEQHFALDAVRDKIADAASRGEGALRLPLGDLKAELRTTDAVQKLLAWCAANKFAVEWADTVLERPNGLKLLTGELVITWVDEKRSH
jgi:hypothetical protein